MGGSRSILFATVAAVAFGGGVAVGALLLSSPPSSAPESAPEAARRPAAPAPAAEEPARAAAPPAAGQAAPAAPLATTTPPALDVRPDEVEFLRAALAKERERRQQSRILAEDGGLDVLKRVREQGADASALLEDFKAFRARVRTGGDVRRIESTGGTTAVDPLQDISDVAVLEFGPGTFEIALDGQVWAELRKGRKSLEIRGAGMDATRIVLRTHTFLMVWENQALENLSVHDLTLDGGGRSMLLDLRGHVAAALERVRLQGWVRAGHAAPIGLSGSAYLACEGCEFLGAGGRQGGFGLSARGPVLAVLQGCLFRGLESAVTGTPADAEGSDIRLLGEMFDGVPVADGRLAPGKRGPAIAIRVRGGQVRFGAPGLKDEERRDKWGAGFLAELQGTTFGPETPVCTLGQILAVADRVSVEPDGVLTRVVLLGSGPAGPDRFGVRVRSAASGKTRWAVVGPDGAPLEQDPRDPGGGSQLPSDEAIPACLRLIEALRKSGIPLDTAATEISLSRNTADEPLFELRSAPGWPSWAVKAKTGEVYAEWK
jgi:hypothetical protein